MGGLMSRRKGYRHELVVRDLLRKENYDADRVPSSGAAPGFKGDIRARGENGEFLVEVKARRREFSTIYSLLDRLSKDGICNLVLGEGAGCVCVSIARTARAALSADTFGYAGVLGATQREVRKLLTLQKFLKECQMLVIHDDNKPYLFLVYR